MPQITLDERTHVYTAADGRVIPSVTQILTDAGLIDTQWFTEQATTRGTYIHEATALDDVDDLDMETLDEGLAGYVAGWRAFLSETGAEILSIEERVCSPAFTYAGTLDRRIMFQGFEWVVDLKSGSPLRWHALQTAAYASLVIPSAAGVHMLKRATVHLKANGRYSFTPHADRTDFDIFGATVALYHWKRTK